MRAKKFILYFVLFLSANILASCHDDKKDPEPSKTELLTTGEWKGKQVLLNGIDVATIPGIGANATTFQTLRLTFMENKTYKAVFETNGQANNLEGNWQFNNTETTVTLEHLGELDIKTLTLQNLDVTTNIDNTNINLIGQLLGIDARLVEAFTGGNSVLAEMKFVK